VLEALELQSGSQAKLTIRSFFERDLELQGSPDLRSMDEPKVHRRLLAGFVKTHHEPFSLGEIFSYPGSAFFQWCCRKRSRRCRDGGTIDNVLSFSLSRQTKEQSQKLGDTGLIITVSCVMVN
jgi:hypothetical protein